MKSGMFEPTISGKMQYSGHIIHPYDLPNLTKLVLRIMLPPIRAEAKAPDLRHALIVGDMGCGKTEVLNWFAQKILDKYGRESINLIAERKISDALDRLDNRPVQAIFIDDAVKEGCSRKSMSNTEDVSDFFEIRHIAHDRGQNMKGLVLCFFATQRFKSLELGFRRAQLITFKTSGNDPDDEKLMRNYLNNKTYAYLERITGRQLLGNQEIKGQSVVVIRALHRQGLLKSEMLPAVLDFSKKEGPSMHFEKFSFDTASVIQKLDKNQAWHKQARAFYYSRYRGMNQERIAEQMNVAQKTVSNYIAQIQGKLAVMAGESYEIWKTEELKRNGWEAIRDGAVGKPDIVAKKGNSEVVYSCKCMDFTRKKTLPLVEFEPELKRSLEDGAIFKISIWNLADGTEQEIVINPKEAPLGITIAPVKKKREAADKKRGRKKF